MPTATQQVSGQNNSYVVFMLQLLCCIASIILNINQSCGSQLSFMLNWHQYLLATFAVRASAENIVDVDMHDQEWRPSQLQLSK